MRIHVRNMVCDRCVRSVRAVFERNKVEIDSISLGVIETASDIPSDTAERIRKDLLGEGFEWLDDQKVKLVESIKNEIIQLVHYGELDEMKKNLSDHLAERLHKDYHYVSSVFSAAENTTIEQYFILQKIEKVKEWLVYGEHTLSEISYRLGYSSVAHLSSQFKKITGFTPSEFKKLKDHQRRSLDKI